MIPKQILKKVKQVEIRTRGLVNDLFGGEYHSVFKGRGMAFSEVREYQPGDDIRLIDWNVTARNRTPFIKIFEEERELTVYLLVDISKSGEFGSQNQLKQEFAAEIASVLGLSAIKNNDKVGLLLFSDQVELFIPPKKGRSHILRIIRELLEFEITRDKIPIYSVDVSYMIDPELGYIKINRFAANTYKEFINASKKLLDNGMKKLVLGLRNNPGGYLDAAINISNEFLDDN